MLGQIFSNSKQLQVFIFKCGDKGCLRNERERAPAHKMAEIIIYIHYLIHTMCKGIQNFITNLNITRKEKKPEVQSMPRTQLGASRDGSRGDGTSTETQL